MFILALYFVETVALHYENLNLTDVVTPVHVDKFETLINKQVSMRKRCSFYLMDLLMVAGPFKKVPFEHFIQSMIGLVPKDNRRAVRLIFHL